MDDMVHIKRFKPRQPFLNRFVDQIWVLESDTEVPTSYEMIPSTSVDLILDFSYSKNSNCSGPSLRAIGLSAVNDRYYRIPLDEKYYLMGISFLPGMAFPFLKVPLIDLKGFTLADFLPKSFYSSIKDEISKVPSTLERIEILEKLLIQHIDPALRPPGILEYTLKEFQSNCLGIHDISERSSISRRTLERQFNHYLGVSPKKYQQIQRIQACILHLYNYKAPFSWVETQEDAFFDQSHYIREFKQFTGTTPKRFLLQQRNPQDQNSISALDIFQP